jgi:mannose-6-phosphate isomerase-like protein (cupin superfamily)
MALLVKKLEECPAFQAGDETRLRELLHPRNDAAADIHYSLAHAALLPGESSLPHTLASSEVYFILSGTGSIYVGEEEAEVGPGDTIYVPHGAVQYLRNTGSGPLTFLCIVEPAWREEDEAVL